MMARMGRILNCERLVLGVLADERGDDPGALEERRWGIDDRVSSGWNWDLERTPEVNRRV